MNRNLGFRAAPGPTDNERDSAPTVSVVYAPANRWYIARVRGVAERLRAALDGWVQDRDAPSDLEFHSRDELPTPNGDLFDQRVWITDQPRRPRERLRIITNIRDNPASSIGDVTRPAALGTMLEGAMAFALDDVIDNRCEQIEIRLLESGAAMITHAGPGFDPERASRGLQRWPWLRRAPEGHVMLTQSLAAPVVTCALSHWCRLEVSRANGVWRQAFYRGEAECALTREPPEHGQQTYTRVCFRPDPEVFGELPFCVDDLYMRGLGFLVELPSIELRIIDDRSQAPPLTMVGTGGLGG